MSLSSSLVLFGWSQIHHKRARAIKRERERKSAEKKETALREESVVHQLVARARRERELGDIINRENKKREREKDDKSSSSTLSCTPLARGENLLFLSTEWRQRS